MESVREVNSIYVPNYLKISQMYDIIPPIKHITNVCLNDGNFLKILRSAALIKSGDKY